MLLFEASPYSQDGDRVKVENTLETIQSRR